jgi:formylmethanofuran:tetrahydromethanopterin formyltransferase
MKEKESVEAIAARCLKDPAFARQVLAGDDHPAVRSAIIADLEEARGVEGALNPQPMPPGDKGFALSLWVQQEKIWSQWSTLRRSNLNGLLTR